MDLSRALHWRYATQRFNPRRKISAKPWRILRESLRLAPSSYDLQPWKFVEVKGSALRAKLRAAAYDQPQVSEAARLLVVCAKRAITSADIRALMLAMAKQRKTPRKGFEAFERRIKKDVASMSKTEVRDWNARQAYIAVGFVLLTAASLGIDACPLEGFDAQKVSRLLTLPPEGVDPLVIIAFGYRSSADAHAEDAKVRFPASQLFLQR